MSLVRTYQVACEGPSLAARLGILKTGPGVLFHDHLPISASADSSAKARRRAIKDGWTRVTKTLPITRDPNGPTSDIKFDLCPSCTKTVGGR